MLGVFLEQLAQVPVVFIELAQVPGVFLEQLAQVPVVFIELAQVPGVFIELALVPGVVHGS